jgi:ferredoxin--NADP+ reductase
MSSFYEAEVLSVHHWTDRLFSFTTTREASFRYQSGQFAMIGLNVEGKPLMRAYSMVSPHYEETLEFLSIKVPDGPLTSRLQNIKTGDSILVGRKASGIRDPDRLPLPLIFFSVSTRRYHFSNHCRPLRFRMLG